MEHIFNYQGTDITFIIDDEIYINATQMAKAFGKKPAHWLELPSTLSFIEAWSSVRKSDTSIIQPVITRMGSPESGGGTLLHVDLATLFATWLDANFAVWCIIRAREVLQYGITTIHGIESLTADMLMNIASKWKHEEQMRIEAERQVTVLKPRAKFYLDVVSSEGLFTFRMAAKIMRIRNNDGVIMGSVLICRDLRRRGILIDETEPYQGYIQKGYFVSKAKKCKDGVVRPSYYVTTKGLAFLFKIYNIDEKRFPVKTLKLL